MDVPVDQSALDRCPKATDFLPLSGKLVSLGLLFYVLKNILPNFVLGHLGHISRSRSLGTSVR